MILQIISTAFLLGCCGIALLWGASEERYTAIGIALAVVASNIVTDGSYAHTENGVLIVDIAVFCGLLVLALRSDRYWPMWAAAFQLVGTMVHFASIPQSGNFAWAYFVALIFWTYPVFIALAAGTWLEGRFRRNT
ncbi:hypothetical protein [Sandarakinorhabdus sp. DWP1-3-1]|uniref:hypothetical protein n=1 Tax=Sandarakinorhabdus sp. DWP1-3-1 TaxID=2804627 RepID=UPI003CFB1402